CGPCTTSRPFAFNSSRLPARTKSVVGVSMSYLPRQSSLLRPWDLAPFQYRYLPPSRAGNVDSGNESVISASLSPRAIFLYLVFGRCGCGVKNSNERSRPPLSGECRLKRLVAGVSGYICECGTKCVAVLKQHGGFAPTVPSR